MNQTYHDAEVIDIIEESPSVRRFFFRVHGFKTFEFKAGQFVMLDFPIEHKFTYRSYSIASAPSSDNVFELCIVLKEDGSATPYLFNEVKVGSILKTTTALGKFTFPDEGTDQELCLVCTGTGIAPLRSMILDIFNRNLPHKEIHLIFGNRWEKDILYKREFEELERIHPEFRFYPVLSRESPETWKGLKGYVHPIYEKIFEDHRPALFYLCGWSAMVREARDRLKAFGYTRKELKFELFD